MANIFALDFSAVQKNDSKESIVKVYGQPFKSVVSEDKKHEICIWLYGKELWTISFTDNKADSGASKIDEIMSSLLELRSAFSAFDDVPSNSKKRADNDGISLIDQVIKDKIEITLLECKIYNKIHRPTAGYRLKVKNRSEKEIMRLRIKLYFYDKTGKVFFEESCTLINSDSYSGAHSLKPNYSILIPEFDSSFHSVSGIDINEWDEGKVYYAIMELK